MSGRAEGAPPPYVQRPIYVAPGEADGLVKNMHTNKEPKMLEAKKLDVTVAKGADLTWLVCLGSDVVGRFVIVGDALAYAVLLECDPRIRREAIQVQAPS